MRRCNDGPFQSGLPYIEFSQDFSEDKTLREWYAHDLAKYESGEIELYVLLIGCVAGSAYALDLMY